MRTPTEIISQAELRTLINQGIAIGHKGNLPAVLLNQDQSVDKFWVKRPRLGKLIKSRSYARRFIKASRQLNRKGFNAPEIISYRVLEDRNGEIVRYRHLPGISIRDRLRESPDSVHLESLSRIYFDLHEAGFFIRTLHFGNILQDDEGTMSLIDCSNLRTKRKPLPLVLRAKNLATPLRYTDDRKRYQEAGLPDFLETYCELANLSGKQSRRLRAIVNRRVTHP